MSRIPLIRLCFCIFCSPGPPRSRCIECGYTSRLVWGVDGLWSCMDWEPWSGWESGCCCRRCCEWLVIWGRGLRSIIEIGLVGLLRKIDLTYGANCDPNFAELMLIFMQEMFECEPHSSTYNWRHRHASNCLFRISLGSSHLVRIFTQKRHYNHGECKFISSRCLRSLSLWIGGLD